MEENCWIWECYIFESFSCRGCVSHCVCDRKFYLLPFGLLSQKKKSSFPRSKRIRALQYQRGRVSKAEQVRGLFLNLSFLICASFKNYTFPFQNILCFVFLIGFTFFYFRGVLGSERKVKYTVFYVDCSFSSGN